MKTLRDYINLIESAQQGVAEGSDSYTVANDPDKPGMHSYREVGHALQSGHSDAAKIYKNNKFLGTVGDVKEQGVAEAAPSTELQDKMRQVRPKGKGITRTELQNAMRRKGKKQWHCPECATYDDNVHGKFCSKYKPKEQGVADKD